MRLADLRSLARVTRGLCVRGVSEEMYEILYLKLDMYYFKYNISDPDGKTGPTSRTREVAMRDESGWSDTLLLVFLTMLILCTVLVLYWMSWKGGR